MVEPIIREPDEPREPRPALGYAMVAVAATLFAVNGTVSKVILGSGIGSQQLTEVRCAGALVGLVRSGRGSCSTSTCGGESGSRSPSPSSD